MVGLLVTAIAARYSFFFHFHEVHIYTFEYTKNSDYVGWLCIRESQHIIYVGQVQSISKLPYSGAGQSHKIKFISEFSCMLLKQMGKMNVSNESVSERKKRAHH